ncbi:MAG: hypothetical protein ACUVXF_11010 [Desulfobaccales bacterium]
MLLLVGAGLLVGCSGSSLKYPPIQPMPTAPSANEEIQKQLLVQSTQTTLANYKD